jgi:hypothetical protein
MKFLGEVIFVSRYPRLPIGGQVPIDEKMRLPQGPLRLCGEIDFAEKEARPEAGLL